MTDDCKKIYGIRCKFNCSRMWKLAFCVETCLLLSTASLVCGRILHFYAYVCLYVFSSIKDAGVYVNDEDY